MPGEAVNEIAAEIPERTPTADIDIGGVDRDSVTESFPGGDVGRAGSLGQKVRRGLVIGKVLTQPLRLRDFRRSRQAAPRQRHGNDEDP